MAEKLLVCVLTVLMLCLVAAGQTNEADSGVEKAKAEQRERLTAAIQEDASQLKLPENRAVINARTAGILWRTDEERARKLFGTAVNDLIAAQQAAEASKNRGANYDLLQGHSLRPQIINTIANHDPEFALDVLRRSRPSEVERALAGPSPDAKLGGSGNNIHLAHNEIRLEQQLIRLAADRNPEKMAALLKESIKKKLSSETLTMLHRIHQTDPAAANDLAREVVARLASTPFFKDNQLNGELLNLSNSIIAEFLRERAADEKVLTFEEAGVRGLAEKVISTYLEHGQKIGWIPLEQLGPMTKRFAPTSSQALKKVAESGKYRGHMAVQPDPEYKKLMDSNPTADVLVDAAKGFPPHVQQTIYQTAASKYAEGGNYEVARSLLTDRLEGEALDGALNSLNWQYAHRLMQTGRFDEAEAAIMEFSDNNRVNALVSLATSIMNAKEEDRPRAARLLIRARATLPARPENSSEMSQIMSIVGVMAIADAQEAARMLSPVIDRINQLAEAFAIVHPFQGSNGVRDGEFILTNGPQVGVHLDSNIFRQIALKEPELAARLVDGFTRPEMRVMMRLGLLDALQ